MSLTRTKRDFLSKGKITPREYKAWKILMEREGETNKWLHWMVSQWIGSSKTLPKKSLVYLTQSFQVLYNKGLIKDKDIYSYSFEELSMEIEAKRSILSQSEKKRKNKSQGAKLLAQKDRIYLYRIDSHEACKEYGKGTKWCITEPNGRAWEDITDRELTKFYFIIDKSLTSHNPLYKVAVAVSLLDKKAYNAEDKKIDIEGFLKDKSLVQFTSHLLPFSKEELAQRLEKEREAIIANSVPDEKAQGYHYKGDLHLNGKIKSFGARSIQEYLGPIKLLSISGSLHASMNDLTGLEGAPQEIGGSLYIASNLLKSLEGAPKYIGSSLICYDNKLESLKGSTPIIPNVFDCSHNRLKSLEGGPTLVDGLYDCSYNSLESLEGSPNNFSYSLLANHNYLTSLRGGPKICPGDFNASYNRLTSLEGSPREVGGSFHCFGNNLESLEGRPNKVRGIFDCSNRSLPFSDDLDLPNEVFVVIPHNL